MWDIRRIADWRPRFRRNVHFGFVVTGFPVKPLDRLRQQVGVLLVMALERHGEIQHRLLQQAALRPNLVCGNRLELGTEYRA